MVLVVCAVQQRKRFGDVDSYHVGQYLCERARREEGLVDQDIHGQHRQEREDIDKGSVVAWHDDTTTSSAKVLGGICLNDIEE